MNKKGFVNIVLIVLVVMLAGALGYVVLVRKVTPAEQTQSNNSQNTQPTIPPPSNDTVSQNTLEYKYYDQNIPFSFRYPKDYCWTQDIAAVVIHKPPFCGGNNAINVEGSNLTVFAFPEEGVKTTEEYINIERLRNLQKTGEKRNIGGYNAIVLVDPQRPSTKIYAFLTNYEFKFPEDIPVPDEVKQQHYKYGVIIQSNLGDESGGKKSEDLILSTFIFR